MFQGERALESAKGGNFSKLAAAVGHLEEFRSGDLYARLELLRALAAHGYTPRSDFEPDYMKMISTLDASTPGRSSTA